MKFCLLTGMFCRRDRGRGEPFMNEDRARAARDFARAIRMSVRGSEL